MQSGKEAEEEGGKAEEEKEESARWRFRQLVFAVFQSLTVLPLAVPVGGGCKVNHR